MKTPRFIPLINQKLWEDKKKNISHPALYANTPANKKKPPCFLLDLHPVQNHDSEDFNSTKVYLEKSLDWTLRFGVFFWQTLKSFHNSKDCQYLVLCTFFPPINSKCQFLTGTSPLQVPAALFINTQISNTSAP